MQHHPGNVSQDVISMQTLQDHYRTMAALQNDITQFTYIWLMQNPILQSALSNRIREYNKEGLIKAQDICNMEAFEPTMATYFLDINTIIKEHKYITPDQMSNEELKNITHDLMLHTQATWLRYAFMNMNSTPNEKHRRDTTHTNINVNNTMNRSISIFKELFLQQANYPQRNLPEEGRQLVEHLNMVQYLPEDIELVLWLNDGRDLINRGENLVLYHSWTDSLLIQLQRVISNNVRVNNERETSKAQQHVQQQQERQSCNLEILNTIIAARELEADLAKAVSNDAEKTLLAVKQLHSNIVANNTKVVSNDAEKTLLTVKQLHSDIVANYVNNTNANG